MAKKKDIETIVKEEGVKTRRHFDVVADDLRKDLGVVSEQVAANADKIDSVAEQVATNTEKITTLQIDITDVKETLGVVKLDLELIKNDLVNRVRRDEFVVLEKRVSHLEIKVARRK